MNVPFSSGIEPILAELCVGISGLKKNPAAVIAAAQTQEVAILNRNKPVAYMVSPKVWDYVRELVGDQKLGEMAREELESDERGIPVTIGELIA